MERGKLLDLQQDHYKRTIDYMISSAQKNLAVSATMPSNPHLGLTAGAFTQLGSGTRGLATPLVTQTVS